MRLGSVCAAKPGGRPLLRVVFVVFCGVFVGRVCTDHSRPCVTSMCDGLLRGQPYFYRAEHPAAATAAGADAAAPGNGRNLFFSVVRVCTYVDASRNPPSSPNVAVRKLNKANQPEGLRSREYSRATNKVKRRGKGPVDKWSIKKYVYLCANRRPAPRACYSTDVEPHTCGSYLAPVRFRRSPAHHTTNTHPFPAARTRSCRWIDLSVHPHLLHGHGRDHDPDRSGHGRPLEGVFSPLSENDAFLFFHCSASWRGRCGNNKHAHIHNTHTRTRTRTHTQSAQCFFFFANVHTSKKINKNKQYMNHVYDVPGRVCMCMQMGGISQWTGEIESRASPTFPRTLRRCW